MNPTDKDIDMNTQPIAMQEPQELTLADTCTLAVFTAHKISTTRQADKGTIARVRREENDESITVNRHLFKKGEVRELLQLMDKAYETHIAMTAPWVDKGPRILPGPRIPEYEKAMNEHIEAVAQARRPVLEQWDKLVREDIYRRTQGGQKSVDESQYPDRYQIKARTFTVGWRLDPISDGNDFRVAVPEYVKVQRAAYVKSAVDVVRNDLLTRLLAPITKAAERLAVPIGEAGAVFRDSLVQNMKDALDQARNLNVGDDPDVAEAVTALEQVLASTGETDALRKLQGHREETAKKLAKLAEQFQGVV